MKEAIDITRFGDLAALSLGAKVEVELEACVHPDFIEIYNYGETDIHFKCLTCGYQWSVDPTL